jgi:hypothetical protein
VPSTAGWIGSRPKTSSGSEPWSRNKSTSNTSDEMQRLLLRLTLGLSLLTGTLLSTGCVSRPRPTADTSWVRPIYFHDETLAWLEGIPDWPPTAAGDFDLIAKHNAKYEAISTHHAK